MELVKEDVDHFVEYILLDKAFREPAKRQTENISGFFVSYLQPTGRMKGKARRRASDLRERRYVCIEVLHRIGGKPIAKAAAEVAYKICQELYSLTPNARCRRSDDGGSGH